MKFKFDIRQRFLRALQNDAGFSQKNPAGFSKPHGLCFTDKKGYAKVILQLADLPA